MSIRQNLLASGRKKRDYVSITAQTCVHTNTGGIATTGYRLNTTGQAQKRGPSYSNITGEWLLVGGVASNYKAKATLANGVSLTTNNFAAYTVLGSSDLIFTLVVDGGDAENNVIVEIARTSDSMVVDSAVIHMLSNGSP